MQMKFKKTGAALLVATITLTGASYAWANENLFDTVDLNEVLNQKESETVKAPKAPKTSTPDTVTTVVTTGDTVGMDIEIPEGYTAGNLAALSKAYENAGNETAKAAIKRNAERAIVKFEAKQEKSKTEDPIVQPPVTEQPKTIVPVTETPVVKPVEEKPVVEKPVKEIKQAEKEEKKALQTEQKEERKALQAEHKEEKKALKEEHKAEKHENKNNKDQK